MESHDRLHSHLFGAYFDGHLEAVSGCFQTGYLKPPLGGDGGLCKQVASRFMSFLRGILAAASISPPTLRAPPVWRRVRRGGG